MRSSSATPNVPAAEPPSICVIGLGYVGQAILRLARRGQLAAFGLDISDSKVQEVLKDDTLSASVATLKDFESARTFVSGSRYILICTPTPLDRAGEPDHSSVTDAARYLSPLIQAGQTVICESTVSPGQTRKIARVLEEGSGLSAGVDFHVCFSSERWDASLSLEEYSLVPKVVAGLTPHCLKQGLELYELLFEKTVGSDSLEAAETSKLLENSFRLLNISFIQEFSRGLLEIGIDPVETIRLAETKPFGFMPFRPGPGIGGHCIPIDPKFLTHHLGLSGSKNIRLLTAAFKDIESHAAWVLRKCIEKLEETTTSPNNASVLLLGVTYRANSGDTRGSSALGLARSLSKLVGRVRVHDPFFTEDAFDGCPTIPGEDLVGSIGQFDMIVVLQWHDVFTNSDLLDALRSKPNLVFSTRAPIETVYELSGQH